MGIGTAIEERVKRQSQRKGKEGAASFFLFREGQERGPFTLRELEDRHRLEPSAGLIPCRRDSESEWHDLGFILRSSACEDKVPAEASKISPGNARSRPDASLRELLAGLAADTRRQNRQLRAIQLGLWAIFIVLVGAGFVLWPSVL